MHSSQVPVELQSAPVEELMDYVVQHTIQWSEQQGWCALLTSGLSAGLLSRLRQSTAQATVELLR